MGNEPAEAVRARPRPRPRALQVEDSQPDQTYLEGECVVERIMYGVSREERETITVPVFHTQPARVGLSAGVTRKLAEFEFVRFDVRIELPAYPVASEIERAYSACEKIVETKIREQNQQVDEALSGQQQNIPVE